MSIFDFMAQYVGTQTYSAYFLSFKICFQWTHSSSGVYTLGKNNSKGKGGYLNTQYIPLE